MENREACWIRGALWQTIAREYRIAKQNALNVKNGV